MPGTLRVLWTIRTSTSIPKPILRCSRCDQQRPFEPSGKFRLNANGKRLDAWLVYRCVECGDSWNRAIFGRKRRVEIDGSILEALQCNDAALAEEVARDVVGLARWTTRFASDGDGAPPIGKQMSGHMSDVPDLIAIAMSAQPGTEMRCDRALAAGLDMSRNRVAALAAEGRIDVDGVVRKPLARVLRQGSLVTVRLAGLADARTLARCACGAGAEEAGPTSSD